MSKYKRTNEERIEGWAYERFKFHTDRQWNFTEGGEPDGAEPATLILHPHGDSNDAKTE